MGQYSTYLRFAADDISFYLEEIGKMGNLFNIVKPCEVMSSLKVNYDKSNVVAVDVPVTWLIR